MTQTALSPTFSLFFFLSNADRSRLPSHLAAAESRLGQATPYEKAVFDSISCLIAKDRDDDAALDSHSQLLKQFPKDLLSLKRAQILCYIMGRPGLCMVLVEQLAEALYAYGRGDYEQAFQLLAPDFNANDYKMIGASDEQLEVFNEVWYSILLNSGRAEKAIGEIEKAIKKREGVPLLWRLLERSYTMANREDAAVASEKAKALEAAYFEHLE